MKLARLLWLVPALAFGQGVDLNTITQVEVKGATIEITGTKKPNFTTFTMTDPARLVIDISEAVFQGVPEELQVGNGTVTAIKTASYGSDASAIARVLVGFEKEYETDIQSVGTKLVVKVLGAGGTAVAESGGTADTAPPDTSAADTAAAEAERKRVAEAEAKAKADADAAARAEAERKRQEDEAAARAEADRKKQEAEAAKQAEADRKRQEAEAAAQAEAERKKAAEEEKRAEAQRQREERLAMNTSRAESETSSREGGASASDSQLSVSNRRKTMELVGFKMQPNGSRVFVRTNEPVRYSVSKGEKNTVVVELENTRIDLDNNERWLDASFFEPNAVAMIDPKPGPTRTVRIQIKLKESVPYETSQQGNELYIDFARPGGR